MDEGRIDSEELKSDRRWCQKGIKLRCFRGLDKGNRKMCCGKKIGEESHKRGEKKEEKKKENENKRKKVRERGKKEREAK